MSAQERVAFHRQQLRQRLGLVAQGKVFSTGIEGLFDDSDLVVTAGESEEANYSGNRAAKVCGCTLLLLLCTYKLCHSDV